MNTQSKLAKPEPIFFWHGHHGGLLFVSNNHLERFHYIKHNKSACEVPLRLRLFKRVKGQLPLEVVQAGTAYVEARQAWQDALKHQNRLREQIDFYTRQSRVDIKAFETRLDEASIACDEANNTLHSARVKLIEIVLSHSEEITALHAIECKNCPWDGETIFTRWSDQKDRWVT
jgi:hypothetical protein